MDRKPSPPTEAVDPGPEARTDRWREWYEALAPAVYGYVRFQVASPEDAEDLTAQTFLKAFRSAGQFDERRGTVRNWILTIARNTVYDHRRRARAWVPLESLRDLASEGESPEERLLWEERVRRVLRHLGTLRSRDREIIALRYGAELEASEMAGVLGLTETAVRTRLWRALNRLRKALER